MCDTVIRQQSSKALADNGNWLKRLKQIASQPLVHCREFPAIARRFEAWWTCGPTDRPIFMAAVGTNPHSDYARRLELLDQPDAWFDQKLKDMREMRYFGDRLPWIRVDLGPAAMGPLLGAPIDFGADTAWTHAFINDTWSNTPDWQLHEDNHWWQRLCGLVERVARDAAGQYLVCFPDLGGASDSLLNMRGPEGMCMDILEQPQKITEAMNCIFPAWRRVLENMYDLTLEHRAGSVHWLGLWSNKPYVVLTCDFNFLIGPHPFREVCLPDISRLAAAAGRSVFHLDGPGATTHIESLLEVPQISAIQFTPGASTPSALPWLDMFRQVQQSGKALLVTCPIDEILPVARKLQPQGLAFSTGAAVDQVDTVFDAFCKYYGL